MIMEMIFTVYFFPYKGHVELVKAVSRTVPVFPGTLFLLVGRDEGTLETCRTLARENGVEGSIRFLGSRTDIPDLLRASDLFVHPSHEEGFSNAILEAMAAGKAVVATNVGGVPEAVLAGETGLLVPARDPESLAEGILALLQDPEKTRTRGEAGRQRVLERFSL